MKLLSAAALLAVAAVAQVTVVGGPRIGLIEYYGLHNVTPALASQALGLRPGDPLPPSKADTEDRLLDIDRVVTARVEAVCCANDPPIKDQPILYVGIEERDAPNYQVRSAPGGGAQLPEAVLQAYEQFEAEARPRNQLDQYFLTPNPNRIRPQFPAVLAEHLEAVREVLRESSNESQRFIAAYVLPYAANKADIVEDLRFALTDNDPAVRASAVRALTELAIYEEANPASRIRVSPLWFLDLLQSVTWSDRMQAVQALERLSRDRDVVLLAGLRGDALQSLIEMSRWQTEQHAYPPFILIGRVAGLTDINTRDAWLRAGRDTVIQQALSKTR